jgi:predicted permease
MAFFGEWVRRIGFLIHRRRFEEALRQEMDAHRAMMDRPARFGSPLRLREESRDVWGWRWLEQLAQDLRFGARALAANPAFALTAILVLALATGATTAIFSVLNGVVLRPLPFAEPDRLVQVYGRSWREDRENAPPDPVRGPVAPLELEVFGTRSTTVERFAGYDLTTSHVDGPAGVERLTTVRADAGLLALLGVAPVAGRLLQSGDTPNEAVISERLWARRFARDPALANKTLRLDNRTVAIVGVMPDAFQFPYSGQALLGSTPVETRTDVWIPLEPLRPGPGEPLRRGRLNVVARLKPTTEIEAATAELRALATQIEQEHYAGTRFRVGVRLEPLADVVLGPVRRSLWMLFAGVGLVLIAACANVANLLLARTAARTREVATRAALGAGRLRLVRQFLVESLLLALAGGLVGALIARWGTNLLLALGAWRMPRAHEVGLDWQSFGFLLAACLVTAVLFGLAPAIAAARADILGVTKDTGRAASSSRGLARLRDGLVVIEVALAFVLALGAALVVRELIRLQRMDAGVTTENVLTLHVTPRADVQHYYAIESRVAQLPGVRAAGFIQFMPLQNWGWFGGFTISGRSVQGRPSSELRYVTPGYFEALGIPLVRGRSFTAADEAGAPRVILINEALARRYFPNEDPVGIELDRGTIVGVTGDVRQATLDQAAEPVIFYPAAQNVAMTSDVGMTLVVRTASEPERLAPAIRAVVRDVNPSLAIFNIKTMQEVVADSLWELNLYRWLVGSFATLALVLATIGLYGVIAYSASSRMREFAVRLALGSEPGRLARLVVGHGARLAAAGLAAGLLAAVMLAPVLRSVSPNLEADWITYAAIGLLLLVVALGACALPALRVAGVNPADALRHE